jgi:predicted nucleotidyltransferase component of viral defense system
MEIDSEHEREGTGEPGMIPSAEIRSYARTSGVPESTIERDYGQNWLLHSIYTIGLGLVLKGGTGIRKVYEPGYRFSDDLDFTLLDDLNTGELNELITTAVEHSKKESGIDFDEDVKVKENVNGFEGTVYFRILRTTGSPLKIKLDVTRKDREMIMLNIRKRKINHPYSDVLSNRIMVYQLEEIIAEKLRSLFERTRPRDMYDIWCLIEKLDKEIIKDIFLAKCRFKNVIPDIDSVYKRRDDFKNSWISSLNHQLKVLPNFDPTFDAVVNLIGEVIGK